MFAIFRMNRSKVLGLNSSTINAVVGLFALLVVPTVRGETWIQAYESTFVAQFRMTITRTCNTPDAKLVATCKHGNIELRDVSHQSIQCRAGSTNSEMECSITCSGKECEKVFINDATGSISFNCASSTDTRPSASIVFNDERARSCDHSLFYNSKAEKFARLGLLCLSDDGIAEPYFGHGIFECGRENEAFYLSHDTYGCKEEQYCFESAPCELSFPPIIVQSTFEERTFEERINYDCFKPKYKLIEDNPIESTLEELDDANTVLQLYRAQYQASWTVYKHSSFTTCVNRDPSLVEISCTSGGLITVTEIDDSIECAPIGSDKLMCRGEGILGNPTVTYTCEGDSSETTQTSLGYEEAHFECDDVAFHLIQMAIFCDGKYSYEDYYWECPSGQITLDQSKRVTCFERIPCISDTNCTGTVPLVIMDSSSNVFSCATVSTLSDPSSKMPSMRPIIASSDFPSMLPSSKPSDPMTLTPSNIPSDLPSLVPSSYPTRMPSSYPTLPQLPFSSPTLSKYPTETHGHQPSDLPSGLPTETLSHSILPSSNPSYTKQASNVPSHLSSLAPSESPERINQPLNVSSDSPTDTLAPSAFPHSSPSFIQQPSNIPSPSHSSISSESPTENHQSLTMPSPFPSRNDSENFTESHISSGVPSKFPTFYPTMRPSKVSSFVPSDSPSISPHLRRDSPTSLTTGDERNDQLIPSALPSRISDLKLGSSNSPTISSTVDHSIVVKGISPDTIPRDESKIWKRAFTVAILLAVGLGIGAMALASHRSSPRS